MGISHILEQETLATMLIEEIKAHTSGFMCIAGVDEVGRGPLAGPIVAAAVVLKEPVIGLNDSKKLSAIERERLYDVLACGPHDIAFAIIQAEEIDASGLQTANYQVMLQAVMSLRQQPDCVLVDGFSIPGLTLPQVRLIKGDARSLSIAAASIVAKVVRDRLMMNYDVKYPGYGFATHKGYGTKKHLEALEKLGPCAIHRKSFAPLATFHKQTDLFDTL